MEANKATDDSIERYTATVDVDSVVKALELNATNGVDDRVIAVPRKQGATAKIRRAFRGSERYSNPNQAPVHIRPESLVEDDFTRPTTRSMVDATAVGVPELYEDRTDDEQEQFEEAYETLLNEWRKNVRGMIEGETIVKTRDAKVVITGDR